MGFGKVELLREWMTTGSFLVLERSGFCFRSFDPSHLHALCFPLGPGAHRKHQQPPSSLDGRCELGWKRSRIASAGEGSCDSPLSSIISCRSRWTIWKTHHDLHRRQQSSGEGEANWQGPKVTGDRGQNQGRYVGVLISWTGPGPSAPSPGPLIPGCLLPATG